MGRREEPAGFFLSMLPMVLTAVSVARLIAFEQIKILCHMWLPLRAGSLESPKCCALVTHLLVLPAHFLGISSILLFPVCNG